MEREIFRIDEISWQGLCMDLIRNAWMILLAAVTVWLAAGGIHNIIYEPQYSSSATLVVSTGGSGNTYSSLSTATQMADVFGQVFQSEALRNLIAADTGEQIQGTVTCDSVEETNLLVLTATSPDPRQAYLYINSALKHYEEVAGDVFSNSVLQVVQEPEVPEQPSNTSWILSQRYLLALLGAFGMAAVICLFYVLRFTVKNEMCASRQLDGKIRGVIPFEKKQSGDGKKNPKQSLLLNSPLVTMAFAEAARSAAAKVEYRMRKKGQKVLLVASVTENEGKSTVAANIALAMAEKRRRVLLIDGDMRKPAQHKVFEIKGKKENSFDQVLTGKAEWKDVMHYSKSCRIWELLQFQPAEHPEEVLKTGMIETLMAEWKENFDYIIIDCSPTAVSTDAEIWMDAADTVLLVVREDWADIRVINDMVDIIWQSGTDFAGFILNAFHREWFRDMPSRYSRNGYSGYERSEYGEEERG